MQSFLARFPVSDITVEEEDIASVVTRLYGAHEEAAG
jgi:ABC-type uncharacterized transport system ATPase subunit